jgi:hypothetical protein
LSQGVGDENKAKNFSSLDGMPATHSYSIEACESKTSKNASSHVTLSGGEGKTVFRGHDERRRKSFSLGE